MLQAEANRNREARPEPFTLREFCLWADVSEKPRPSSEAGAAMLDLLERGLLPSFVLDGPWLADLEAQGRGVKPPPRLCWAAEDAIVLAPHRVDGHHWGGFLVARASACGQVREFTSEQGDQVALRIPEDVVTGRSFAAARGGAVLAIASRENCP